MSIKISLSQSLFLFLAASKKSLASRGADGWANGISGPVLLPKRQQPYLSSPFEGHGPVIKELPVVIPVGQSTYTVQEGDSSATLNAYSVLNSATQTAAQTEAQISSLPATSATGSGESQPPVTAQSTAIAPSSGSLNALSALTTIAVSSQPPAPSPTAESASANAGSILESSPVAAGSTLGASSAAIAGPSSAQTANAYTVLNSAIITESGTNSATSFPILPPPAVTSEVNPSSMSQNSANSVPSSIATANGASPISETNTISTPNATPSNTAATATATDQPPTTPPVILPPGLITTPSVSGSSEVPPPTGTQQSVSAAGTVSASQATSAGESSVNPATASLPTESQSNILTSTQSASPSGESTTGTGSSQQSSLSMVTTSSESAGTQQSSETATATSSSARGSSTAATSTGNANRPATTTAAPPVSLASSYLLHRGPLRLMIVSVFFATLAHS